ncbi:MAG: hypothetical protein LBD12_07665 [Clostridiales Family XIII bacterium]|jgi:hypothetical protein|nr:hypothetical protein [Clostridiales Family XIII bacterium]
MGKKREDIGDGHSETFMAFRNWVASIKVAEKISFYWPYLFHAIHDWERDEAEDLIYSTFVRRRHPDFAKYMPQLRNYDGMAALRGALSSAVLEKYVRIKIAAVLYNETGDAQYLRVFEEAYGLAERWSGRFGIAGELKRLCLDAAVFDLLAKIYVGDGDGAEIYAGDEDGTEIYVGDGDGMVRSLACDGLLYCKGYLDRDLGWDARKRECRDRESMLALFETEDIEERRALVERLRADTAQDAWGGRVPAQWAWLERLFPEWGTDDGDAPGAVGRHVGHTPARVHYSPPPRIKGEFGYRRKGFC